MSNVIKINLNDMIKVKLTNFGKTIYRHQCEEINAVTGSKICKIEYPTEDEDGYAEFQLWDFMQLYGRYMSMGSPNVIEPLEIICKRRTDD